jgi:putative peptidoglycan lipid II flippase
MSSRLLGLAREQLVAYLFGASHAVDAFNVAFRIPNLLRDLFAEGAMSAAFVPTFTRYLSTRSRADAWELGSRVMTVLVVATGAVAVLGMIFAGPIVRLFAADYAAVPGKLELTVTLARVMFPFLTLVAIAAAAMGMLNSLSRFFVPALSPAMFNVGTIVTALLLVPVLPRMGWPAVTALAIGTLVGGLGQIVLQWPALRREGFRYRPRLGLQDEGLRQIMALMLPGLVGLAGVQINVFVNTVLATGEGEGAVSWLNYAFRLMHMPIGLFGVSVATAALPSLSRHAANQDRAAVRATLSDGLRLMLMLNVPATAGLIALSTPIVALLFEHGAFTAADTAATSAALICYAIGLVGYSAVKLAVPAFYALKDSRTPVTVSLMTVALNVGLNLWLVRLMGYRGLALGTAIAALLNAAMLLELLRRKLGGLEGRRVSTAFAKIVAASALMAIVARSTAAELELMLPGGSIVNLGVRVGAAILCALFVLALAARGLRIAEFEGAVNALWRRVRPSARSAAP